MKLYMQKTKTKQWHQYQKHQSKKDKQTAITITNTVWYIISYIPNARFQRFKYDVLMWIKLPKQ